MLGGMRRRILPALALLGLALACHGRAHWPEPQRAQPRTRTGGRCPASGIHSSGKCAKIDVPSVDASSPSGCKSDAECGGWDGRCIENPSYDPRFDESRSGSASIRRSAALLGEAPRPPAPTMCVSDECHDDLDCSRGSDRKMGCECGTGRGVDRNRCIRLDACLADADCKPGARCECDHDGPNYCLPANCDSDAECNGLACADAPSGRYCRTKNDRCARDADCPPNGHFIERCDYDVPGGMWRCFDEEPPPPG